MISFRYGMASTDMQLCRGFRGLDYLVRLAVLLFSVSGGSFTLSRRPWLITLSEHREEFDVLMGLVRWSERQRLR